MSLGLFTELNDDLAPFRSQIVDEHVARMGLALARQKRIAAANARIQHRMVEGLGEVVASIDADLFHGLARIYGYETVRSPDFLRCLLRDNPEIRVKSVAEKLTLRVNGFKEAA